MPVIMGICGSAATLVVAATMIITALGNGAGSPGAPDRMMGWSSGQHEASSGQGANSGVPQLVLLDVPSQTQQGADDQQQVPDGTDDDEGEEAQPFSPDTPSQTPAGADEEDAPARETQTDAEACVRANLLSQRKAFVKERGPSRADAWRRAALEGVPEAQYLLGICHFHGVEVEHGADVKRDSKLALDWLRRAAAQSYGPAMADVGWMYQNGYGVTQDAAQAGAWYQKGVEQRCPAAMNQLGVMFAKGLHFSRDDAEALRLFRRAAEMGNVAAMNNVGVHYDRGFGGVEQDHAEAVRWFRQSAEEGYPVAMWNLGLAYEKGTGVAKDHEQALIWWRKSALAGDPEAQAKLQELGESW